MRYIGSKINLLDEIDSILSDKGVKEGQVFLDLFAGTNSVGEHFKNRFTVFSNDSLFFSFADAKSKIEGPENISFNRLKDFKIRSVFEFLNTGADKYSDSAKSPGYYELAYSPTGDAQYLSTKNARRIDFIRDQIDCWFQEQLINEYEYYYLISCLTEAISLVSNTTGTYGAFLKHWDKRALNNLHLTPNELLENNLKHQSFNEDVFSLIKHVSANITYVDPPYNTRQYASNYHLLENVARNTKPDLYGKTKMFDWSNLKSDFATKRHAYKSFEKLFQEIQTDHLVFSYNTEGIVELDSLISLLKEYSIPSEIEVKRIPYRKYKSKKPSTNYDLEEVLIYARFGRLHPKTMPTSIEPARKLLKVQPDKALIKSPVNYIGGKYKLLKQILPYFPSDIDTFVDLFSGGANVGINVDAQSHIFNDMNNRVNEMFRLFQTTPSSVLVPKIESRIKEWNLSKTNESAFIAFRAHYNSNPTPLDLYVLSAFSYNYQFRFNNRMQYNNPFGRNRSCFSDNMKRNLILFSDRLKELNATFTDDYFENFNIEYLDGDDFVYMDPPYLITTGSYNDGNRGYQNWGNPQEEQLLETMKKLNRQGVRYALSNVLSHKGQVNSLLLDFIEQNDVKVHQLKFDYDNSSHNSKGRGSEEVLITNY